MTDTATARNALTASALGFGVAGVLAPKALATAYGAPDPTPEHLYTVRIWGAATAAIGAIGLLSDGLDDKAMLQVALGLNALDTVIGLTSGATPRGRVMTAGTSAGLAALAAFALRDA